MSYSHPLIYDNRRYMGNPTGQNRTRADLKAAKRAEALRANLKRRKESEAAKIAAQADKEGERNAKPENHD